MLKGIPSCISPELMAVMMRMGHGDELILADADFPAESCNARVLRADGVGLVELLRAILPLYPLDPFVEKPAAIMAPVGDATVAEAIWTARALIAEQNPGFDDYEQVERFDFYRRAKNAFAVVVTGEPDGNLILKKGVVNL